MKLHVPLVRQSKNSSDCGLAGVVMLMRYHGRKNTSIENLRQFLQVDAGGTYGPQLGRFLLSQGFSVRIITHHPGLFTNRDRQKNQSAILDHIRGLLRKEKGAQNKKTLRHFRDFLKAGGTIVVKVPDANDIRSEIRKKRPVCALLTSNFLHGKTSEFNFHFNIVTGIDRSMVYVNDPHWDHCGGRHSYCFQDFFYGLYASCHGDLDNACLITAKPALEA